MVRVLLLLLICGLGTYVWFSQDPPPINHPPGVLVTKEPLQQNPDKGNWLFGEYTIRPLAKFEMSGRVLGKTQYNFDRESELAPYDLALGWLQMSDTRILKHIDLSQAGRWYYMSWNELPPDTLDPNVFSANMHMIPSTEEISNKLDSIRTGHVISLKGYLVQVIAKDDWAWTSSTSRYDLGQRSCELVWVDKLRIENPQASTHAAAE